MPVIAFKKLYIHDRLTRKYKMGLPNLFLFFVGGKDLVELQNVCSLSVIKLKCNFIISKKYKLKS